MVQAKCIQKFKDKHGKITGYLLEDCNGQQLRVSADQLKMAMFSQQIQITNLKFTKDGRLIDADKSDNADKRNKCSTNYIADSVIEIIKVLKMELPEQRHKGVTLYRNTEDNRVYFDFFAITEPHLGNDNRITRIKEDVIALDIHISHDKGKQFKLKVKTVHDYKDRQNYAYNPNSIQMIYLLSCVPSDYICKDFTICKDTFDKDISSAIDYIKFRLDDFAIRVNQMRIGGVYKGVSLIQGERLQSDIE